MPNILKTDRPEGASDRSSGWLACAGFVLAALLVWQSGQYTQRNWDAPQRWDVVLEGQHYRVGGAQLQWLEDFSSAHFAADGEHARELVRAEVNAQLDTAFAQVSARLPAFVDWYYSLGGEYSRLSMAVLGHLNRVEEDYVARRAAGMLFPEPAWEASLVQLDSATTQLLMTQQARSQAAWLSELQHRLSANRVPAPVTSTGESATSALVLDGLMSQLQTLQQTPMMDTRLTLSTIGAASVAGPALWRAVSARAALKMAGSAGVAGAAARGATSQVATKTATKVAARGASGAVASAAAGAGAVCLPGGPVAIACAAVAAAGTWIATDWLLLQIDQARNGDEMLAGLEEGLDALRLELEAALLQVYDERIAAWQEAANVQIERTFSPRNAR